MNEIRQRCCSKGILKNNNNNVIIIIIIDKLIVKVIKKCAYFPFSNNYLFNEKGFEFQLLIN
jgi:hypothetical protein